MLIKLIVVRSSELDPPWVADAWDEGSVDENPEGWGKAVAKANEAYGASYVRVVNMKIPDDTLVRTFKEPVVDGVVEEAKESSL
jgi:hypothetical protein